MITAQDGSGTASAFIGNGKVLAALTIPRPDKIGMMQKNGENGYENGSSRFKVSTKKR
jgi:hypothetical protein